MADRILIETGDVLLLESGDAFLLEISAGAGPATDPTPYLATYRLDGRATYRLDGRRNYRGT